MLHTLTKSVGVQEALKQLVVKRIGMELFLSRLGDISRLEAHGRAAKQPQLRARTPQDLLLDYEFCTLYKLTEGNVPTLAEFNAEKKNNPLFGVEN